MVRRCGLLLQTEWRGLSVGLFVCLSVCHSSELCKTAEPIEMPFRFRTQEGPWNSVLDGGPDSPLEGAIMRGGEFYCKV